MLDDVKNFVFDLNQKFDSVEALPRFGMSALVVILMAGLKLWVPLFAILGLRAWYLVDAHNKV